MGERIFTRDDAKSIIRTTSEKVKLPADYTVIGKGALAGFSQIKELTIPEGVKKICSHAFFIRSFKGTSMLERLVIPSSLREIDLWSFYDCNSLKSVVLPEDFPEQRAMELFFHCPNAVLTFGKKLFAGKKKTVQQIMDESSGILSLGSAMLLPVSEDGTMKIPSNYTYILPYAMRNSANRGIKRVVIPGKMRIISPGAFSYLTTLEEIEVSEGAEYVDNGAFASCKNLKRIILPDSVSRIGAGAFMNLPSLRSIRLPKNLTEIEDELFSGCTELRDVTFGGSESRIGAGAFNECSSLEQMRLPETVTSVGICAFWNCTSLKKLVIPSGVESIGQSALCNCHSLSTLYMPPILHDSREQKRVFGEHTSPQIMWLEPGTQAPDLSEISSDAFDIPEVPSSLPFGFASSAQNDMPLPSAAVSAPSDAPLQQSAADQTDAAVDAETVRRMQESIAAMQAQLAAMQRVNGTNAQQPDFSALASIQSELAAMQQAVSTAEKSSAAISAMEQKMDTLSDIESRVDEIAEKQESVQAQVNAISEMQEAVGIPEMAAEAVHHAVQEPMPEFSPASAEPAVPAEPETVPAESDISVPETDEASQLTDTVPEIPAVLSAEQAFAADGSESSEANPEPAFFAVPKPEPELPPVSEEPAAPATLSDEPAVQAEPAALPEEPAVQAEPATLPEEPAVQAEPVTLPEEPAVQAEPVTLPEEPAAEDDDALQYEKFESFDQSIAFVPLHLGEYGAGDRVFTSEISKPMPGPKERSAALKEYSVIGYRAFREAQAGERFEIPEGVRRVSTQAFWDAPRLMAIEIPTTLSEVEPDAFSGASRLTDIYVRDGYSERKIVEFFLFRPDAKVHWPKKGLLSKPRISTIAELMEQFDDILTPAKAKKLTVRGHLLHIPEGYTIIAPGALQQIDQRSDDPEQVLRTIFLPKSVRRIGTKAFAGLENVMHIVIPSGLQIVDMNAFTGCLGPRRIVLPDTVQYIGPCAFAAPCNYEQIRLPGMIRVLPENAIAGCNTLVALRIPDSVRQIGDCALAGCTALTSLTIPKRFEEQLPAILDGPVKLNVTWTTGGFAAYQLPPTPEFLSVVEPDFSPVNPQRQFTQELSASCSNFAERVNMLHAHPFIAPGALSEMANQTKFEIPLGVLRLASYSFGLNTRLLTLTVPKALNEFDYACFYGCQRLRDVFLPEEFDRGSAAVLFMRRPQILVTFGTARAVRVRQLTAECPWILSAGDAADLKIDHVTMKIPEGYLVIASYMYHGIIGQQCLHRIELPHSVRLIGSLAFSQLPYLEEIICPEGLLAVEPEAFTDCPVLKRVVLPRSLRFLGVHAFYGCNELTSIVLPGKFADRAAEITRDCPQATITWIPDEVADEQMQPASTESLVKSGETVIPVAERPKSAAEHTEMAVEKAKALLAKENQTETEPAVPEEVAETETPVPEEAAETEIPVPEEVTETEIPVSEEVTETELPVPEEAAETEIPVPEEAAETEIPVPEEAAETEIPVPEEVTETELPVPEEVTETEIPVSEEVTETELPVPEEAGETEPAVQAESDAENAVPSEIEAIAHSVFGTEQQSEAGIPSEPSDEAPEAQQDTDVSEEEVSPEIQALAASLFADMQETDAQAEVEPELYAEESDSLECSDLRELSNMEPLAGSGVSPEQIGRSADNSPELADIHDLEKADGADGLTESAETVEEAAEAEEPAEEPAAEAEDMPGLPGLPEPEEIALTPAAEAEDMPGLSGLPEPEEVALTPAAEAEEPAEEPAAEAEDMPGLPELDMPEEPAIGAVPEAAASALEVILPDEEAAVPEMPEQPEPEDEPDAAVLIEKMQLADALGITLDDSDIVQIMTEEPPEWPVHVEDFGSRIEPGMLPESELAGQPPIPEDGKFTAKECRMRYKGEPEFRIPHGFTEIRAGACAAMDDLEKLIVPDTVVRIGSGAFSDSPSLTEIYIPASVEEIAEDAFEGCDSLIRVTMPRTLEAAAAKMFGPQTHVIWIESEKPAIIGDGRFTAKIRAKVYDGGDTLVIPEGYTEIRAGACAGLEDLMQVTLPATLTKICGGAFADCTGLTEMTLPAGVTELDPDAFEGCTGIRRVIVKAALAEAAKQCFPNAAVLVTE